MHAVHFLSNDREPVGRARFSCLQRIRSLWLRLGVAGLATTPAVPTLNRKLRTKLETTRQIFELQDRYGEVPKLSVAIEVTGEGAKSVEVRGQPRLRWTFALRP